jgi:hypothetical protein
MLTRAKARGYQYTATGVNFSLAVNTADNYGTMLAFIINK